MQEKKMQNFNNLTMFIDKFQNIEYGKLIIDDKNDGSPEHPRQMPYIKYHDLVYDFISAICDFQSGHTEFDLINYKEILHSQLIEWNIASMEGAIVEDLNAETVLALLIGILRLERFCEGTLLSMLKNGVVQRCLMRLKEIDND